MTIAVVAGPIANKLRNGGNAWVPHSYAAGLRSLGFEVFLLEEIAPSTCTDQRGSPAAFRDSRELEFFTDVAGQLGLGGHDLLACGEEVWGIGPIQLGDILAGADLLINISGHLTLTPLLRGIRHKVYVDLDPGYTQFWHVQGNPGPRLAGHDAYFTVGTNLGRSDCLVPSGDIRWFPTLPPTVLEDWPATDSPELARFTTVASWRGSYGRVVDGDLTYGLKAHEFRRFVNLPGRVPAPLEIALDIHQDDRVDRELLLRGGWGIVDPAATVPGPIAFQSYVRGSFAEFSVAQGIYVETRSGWFSDRTARYLASGRPAVVQDTGVGRTLPVGEGLLTFRSPEEAEVRIRDVMDDPERHAKAARAVAEEYLDSDAVLGRLLEIVGVAP